MPAAIYTYFILWPWNNKCWDKFLCICHSCNYQLPFVSHILFYNLCVPPIYRGHTKSHKWCGQISPVTAFSTYHILTSSPLCCKPTNQNTCHIQSDPCLGQLSIVYSETYCNPILKQSVNPTPILPVVFLSTSTPHCLPGKSHTLPSQSFVTFQADHCSRCNRVHEACRWSSGDCGSEGVCHLTSARPPGLYMQGVLEK